MGGQFGGSTPMPGSYEHLQKYGTWGGAAPGSPAYHGAYGTFGDPTRPDDPNRNPHLLTDERYGFSDIDRDRLPSPSPFEFPEVSPFASGASNFNAQDVLSRIAGPTLPQTTFIPPASTFAPATNVNIPAALSSLNTLIPQGDIALQNLLSQAPQSSFADLGGVQETLAAGLPPQAIIQNQAGGPVQFATGGEFAGHVQGVGDGMSDQIPFHVVPQTPQDIPNAPDMAVLSTDEYVFPADAVSMLGNGSSDAGAKILDNAVKNVRRASIGTPTQIKEIDGQKVLKGALTT